MVSGEWRVLLLAQYAIGAMSDWQSNKGFARQAARTAYAENGGMELVELAVGFWLLVDGESPRGLKPAIKKLRILWLIVNLQFVNRG